MKSIALVVTTYRNPPKLAALIDNMRWAGLPDLPLYVFVDPSPLEDSDEQFMQYAAVRDEKNLPHLEFAPKWGCMQGILDYAMQHTTEDWVIYIPDDIIFSQGGLWNEVAGVMAYGRDFVGAIQMPYWNAQDLVDMCAMPHREAMFQGWLPIGIPHNPFWNRFWLPRKYINVNGAGFAISRDAYREMDGIPQVTWRLDEWVGWKVWTGGRCCVTLPGPPRIHYHGGSTPEMPTGLAYNSIDAWVDATGGYKPEECGVILTSIMDALPNEEWPYILSFFQEGRRLPDEYRNTKGGGRGVATNPPMVSSRHLLPSHGREGNRSSILPPSCTGKTYD